MIKALPNFVITLFYLLFQHDNSLLAELSTNLKVQYNQITIMHTLKGLLRISLSFQAITLSE